MNLMTLSLSELYASCHKVGVSDMASPLQAVACSTMERGFFHAQQPCTLDKQGGGGGWGRGVTAGGEVTMDAVDFRDNGLGEADRFSLFKALHFHRIHTCLLVTCGDLISAG